MKYRKLLTILLMTAMLFAACSNERKQAEPDQNIDASEPIEAIEEPAPETDDSADSDEDAVVVDGYDITAAVTGTSLKEAFQDYFRFGVGLNGTNTSNDTVQSAAMREIIKHQFNSVTYSNLMKPQYLLDQNESMKNADNGLVDPAVKFDTVIAGLEFGKENNIQMRGHVLVWHAQVPAWFFREGYRTNGEFVSREIMLQRMESYIKQVLEFTQTEYPGVIYCWDVVNEAVEVVPGHYETETGLNIRTKHGKDEDNLWYKVIGADYIEKAFEYARKYADPDVLLFYNDYNTFQPVKTSKIYDLVSGLKEKGLIDGIGMQGYMSLNYPGITAGGDNWKRALEKFAELGLEIHVTELTVSSDNKDESSMQRQAKRYEDLFRLFLSLHTRNGGPLNMTSVTVFGLMDEYLFYPNDKNYSRLFDGNLQPKPAFHSIMSALESVGEQAAPVSKPALTTTAIRGTPVIDGNIDDVWNSANAITTDRWVEGKSGSTAKVRTLWDDGHLYVLAEVTDSLLTKRSANVWEQDSIEIFIDQNNAKAGAYEPDDAQYRVNFENEVSVNPASMEGNIVSAVRKTDAGYVVEASIAWTGTAPKAGDTIGFDFQVNNDENDDGVRDSVAIWNDTSGQSYQDTSGLGLLQLSGEN